MKKRFFLAAIVLLVALFAGCSAKLSGPPQIVITVGKVNVDSVVGLIRWNASVYNREDTYRAIMKGKTRTELPYIQLNEEIQIDFKGAAPDTVELRDYILNADGSIKYTEKEINIIPIKFKDKQCSFTLAPNPAAFLSSDTSDYEPGATIRLFRLTCKWGENECEYAFIIRSDAS